MAGRSFHGRLLSARYGLPAFTACFVSLLSLTLPAAAQQDPAWPCAQRLVPQLSAGSYWPSQVTANPHWRDDDAVFALVTLVVDRDTTDADAAGKVKAYAAGLSPVQKSTLFSAIVDQTNDIRDILVRRLIKLGRRQIAMGQAIANLSNKLDNLKAEDPAREALAGERDLDVRAFGETQHIMRYACEAPANMERRLGTLARLLSR